VAQARGQTQTQTQTRMLQEEARPSCPRQRHQQTQKRRDRCTQDRKIAISPMFLLRCLRQKSPLMPTLRFSLREAQWRRLLPWDLVPASCFYRRQSRVGAYNDTSSARARARANMHAYRALVVGGRGGGGGGGGAPTRTLTPTLTFTPTRTYPLRHTSLWKTRQMQRNSRPWSSTLSPRTLLLLQQIKASGRGSTPTAPPRHRQPLAAAVVVEMTLTPRHRNQAQRQGIATCGSGC
jgi:hypothetical protein